MVFQSFDTAVINGLPCFVSPKEAPLRIWLSHFDDDKALVHHQQSFPFLNMSSASRRLTYLNRETI